MLEPIAPPRSFGQAPRGVTQSDVSHAADTLLRAGERPTIDKVRAKIGKGSPNTINPMLDVWWKTLEARLDSGPAALHRVPESVAHIAEALWMQALEETRRRIAIEQRDSTRVAELDKQRLELRSHALSLREGELDSRLRDRDRTIEELNLRLRELRGLLQKEQTTRESLLQRITTLETLLARRQPQTQVVRVRKPTTSKKRKPSKRPAVRNSAKRKKTRHG
jgi:hypothetical protein